MSKKRNYIFIGLHVIAWIIFVALSIEAGGLIANFIFSICKPETVPYLYQKLDLTGMYQTNQPVFFGTYSFILCIAVLKCVLFYTVVILMHKIDLSKPFSQYVSDKISKISYYTFSIGLLSYIGQQVVSKQWLHYGYDFSQINEFWSDAEAFIIMAAIIYIIAVIFKKGLEIQNENDLTV